MAKNITETELERIGDRVFRAYRALPAVQAAGPLLRVDPRLLLEAVLGLRVEFGRLSRDGKTLGMTARDEMEVEPCAGSGEFFALDGKTVLVEKGLLGPGQEGRRNFTIAHEGCHHILWALCPEEGGAAAGRVVRCREAGARTREERQVDRLASAILMHRELVGRAMFLTGLDGGIGMLNPVWRREEYGKFDSMRRMLGVSKQALRIRMTGLGLIGEEHLLAPDEILDVWMGDDETD